MCSGKLSRAASSRFCFPTGPWKELSQAAAESETAPTGVPWLRMSHGEHHGEGPGGEARPAHRDAVPDATARGAFTTELQTSHATAGGYFTVRPVQARGFSIAPLVASGWSGAPGSIPLKRASFRCLPGPGTTKQLARTQRCARSPPPPLVLTSGIPSEVLSGS